MEISLKGKLALITGSSGGIGKAIAELLASAGAKVAVHYLNNGEAAEDVVRRIASNGGEAARFGADISNTAEIERLVTEIEDVFKQPIDILVNNAGHLIERRLNEDMTEQLYDAVMDVNFKSTVFACKHVIPGMKRIGGGVIINMASVAVLNGGGSGAQIYAASKSAIQTYSKGLAAELASSGIRVNVLAPGFIGQTAFHDTFTPPAARNKAVEHIPLGREGTPEDVAGSALFLASELARYITGHTIHINGGMYMS